MIGLGLAVWFWVFGSKGLYETEQLRTLKQELMEEKEKLNAEKQRLESQLKHLKDPAYQKHVIHRELGYVEGDEILIQIPSP